MYWKKYQYSVWVLQQNTVLHLSYILYLRESVVYRIEILECQVVVYYDENDGRHERRRHDHDEWKRLQYEEMCDLTNDTADNHHCG